MDFKYYNYEQDLFKEIIKKEAEVYIFKNYQDLKEALRVYQPQPLKKQSLFLTLDEFKERLFSSEKILLKEEKLPLLLYSVLRESEKSELRLDSYQDIYQFSDRFFSFFNLLLDYQIKELKGLTGWQKNRVQRLNEIKERYQNKLNELAYLDQLSAREERNINSDFLDDYQRINFFNILDFTPYFKDILDKLSQKFEVEIHLQLKEGDFSESELELKKITLPKAEKVDIEIRENTTKLKSLAAILNETAAAKAQLQIIDAGAEIEEADILSKELELHRHQSYQQTEVYNFLNGLYQLYQEGKKGADILIKLKDLYDLTSLKSFRDWLNLGSEELLKIKKFIREDYYYLDQDLVDQELSNLKELLDFLKKIRQVKNIIDLRKLLDQIADFILAGQEKELVEKFYDSLLELKSIEEMGVVNTWQDYFSDRGGGLFALFLNHLAFKSISLPKNEEAVEFFTLDRAAVQKREKLLINNCIQDHFTLKGDGLYFLSEKQLQDNGLKLKHKKQLLKRYNFLRHIFNAEKSIIFTVENEGENISPAVILEELVLEYELDYKQSKLEELSEKEILNNLFDFDKNLKIKVNDSADFNQDLAVEKADFGSSFNFSYYKYKHFKDCFYRFYLEELVQLDTVLEIKPALSLMALGILTHEIFGELIIYARNQGLDPAEIPAEVREKIIKKEIKENELKIDKDYLNYYHQIIYKSLNSSFIRFAELLQKYLPESRENILVEWPEWNYQRKKYFSAAEIDFYLSGRIDLLLLKNEDYFIIDFKTGSGDKKQLDFYSLMLRQNYEEQLPQASKKAIYNVFAEDFEHSYNKIEKEDKIGSEIQDLTAQLFSSAKYYRIYKSRCQSCPYLDICRVEVKSNEKSY